MDEVYRVYIPMPVRVGEHASKEAADKQAAELGSDAVVVARFSAEEQKILRQDLRRLGKA